MTAPQRETATVEERARELLEKIYCECPAEPCDMNGRCADCDGMLKWIADALRAAQREAGEAMREKIIALIMERDGRMRTDTLAAIRALPVEAKGPHGQPK